jgi:hypothetical protein
MAAGQSIPGAPSLHETDDPMEILRRLMKDREPGIRLRAVSEYFDLKRRQELEKTPVAKTYDDIAKRATPDQREELSFYFRAIRALVATIAGQTYQPSDERALPTDYTPPAPEPLVEEERAAQPAIEAEVKAYSLTDRELEACGVIRINGHLVHALGDDHAEKIASGEMPFEEARAAHRRTLTKQPPPKIFDPFEGTNYE